MYVSPQDTYGTIASGVGAYGTGLESDFDGNDTPLSMYAPGDAVSRMMPPIASAATSALEATLSPLSSTAPGGQVLGGLLQSLGGILGQISQALGGGTNGANGSSGFGGFGGYGGIGNPGCQNGTGVSNCGNSPQQYYANASGSSTGDPHLAFSANGNNATWDSMTGHNDLLDSNSFNGGFQVSTQTTTPNANGVTFNGSASVATRNGNTRVTLDNQGNATIDRFGQSFALQNGQSYDLGGGESVSRGNDGSVDVTERNAQGGSIDTTLRDNGPGVDVNVQANDVNLGGDLANAGGRQNPPTLAPMPGVGVPAIPHAPHARPPHHQLEPLDPGYDE
jgi:hypothetical protein